MCPEEEKEAPKEETPPALTDADKKLIDFLVKQAVKSCT